jgi:RNA polymerase sigma-70 factor, ECF subfamily
MPADEVRFWIYRVARNLALNELTKMRTRNRLVDRVRMALTPKTQHPEDAYEKSERSQILAGLLASLTEPQRAALVLREQQEMSYAEIARVLNISENKVKVDIHRARMKLREKWTENYEAPERANTERRSLP